MILNLKRPNMERQNTAPSEKLTSSSMIAIVVIVFTGCWIAFAYNQNLGTDDSQSVFLLHPIVAVLLILLLVRVRKLVEVPSVVYILIVMIGLWLFINLSSILTPFFFGFGLAYFFRFIVGEIQEIPLPFGRRLRVPKIVASLILFSLTLGIISLLFWIVIPQIVEQTLGMSEGLVKFYRDTVVPFVVGTNEGKGILDKIEDFGNNSESSLVRKATQFAKYEGQKIVDQVQNYLTANLGTLAETGTDFFGRVFRRFSSMAIGVGGFLTTAFLTLMVLIYAGHSLEIYVGNFVDLFPLEKRDFVWQYLREINKNMEAFLRGQVVVILVISLISIVVYSVIGVPFALVVGLVAGISNAIPTFGPFIGGFFAMLALLMGFAAGNFLLIGFLVRMVAIICAILGIQAIDNSLISPRILSNAVDVDPLLIMFGVIVGASVFGFWGVILAIPIIVVLKSIVTVSKELYS